MADNENGSTAAVTGQIKVDGDEAVSDGAFDDESRILLNELLPSQRREPSQVHLQRCLREAKRSGRLLKQEQEETSWTLMGSARHLIQVYTENYVLLTMTAALCISLNATCIKILTDTVSVFQVVFTQSLSAGIVFFGICRWKGYPIVESRHKLALCVTRGILGACGNLCWAFTTFTLPLSEAGFMTNSYPAVTAVLSSMLGMERLGIWSWIGVFGCVIGNSLMAHPPFLFGGHADFSHKRILGFSVAGCANIILGATFLFIGFIGKRVPSIVLPFYLYLCSLIICIPFLIAGYPEAANSRHSFTELLCYAGCCFSGVVVQFTLTRALQVGSPTKTTALYLTNMISSGLVGLLLLGEEVSWLSLLGALVIFVSVLTVVLQRSKKADPSPGSNDLEQSLTTEYELKI